MDNLLKNLIILSSIFIVKLTCMVCTSYCLILIELNDGQCFNLHAVEDLWLEGKIRKAFAVTTMHGRLMVLPNAANLVNLIEEDR